MLVALLLRYSCGGLNDTYSDRTTGESPAADTPLYSMVTCNIASLTLAPPELKQRNVPGLVSAHRNSQEVRFSSSGTLRESLSVFLFELRAFHSSDA